jgi:hypothetical protein
MKLEMNVFPNPATDHVNVTFNLEKAGDAEILLIDELGRIIQTERKRNLSAGTNQAELNIAHLASGVYYVRLQSGTISESKTLIRQ